MENIIERHQNDNYDFRDDAVLVVDVSPGSPGFCEPAPLDMGEGNFPFTIEAMDRYYPNDPRAGTQQLVFEEVEEDLNGNGVLDLGEDLDMDGVLDHPNLRHPGGHPWDDLLTFYERETNTLVMRPVLPLREATSYAVVLTERLKDESGRPVRSPFRYVNHAAQTEALRPLDACLPRLGLSLDEVAFTWSFTTQSASLPFRAIRDGMYGVGPMAYLAERFPPEVSDLYDLRKNNAQKSLNVKIVPGDQFLKLAKNLVPQLVGPKHAEAAEAILASHKFVDFHVVGSFESPGSSAPRRAGKHAATVGSGLGRGSALGKAFVRSEKVTFWLTVPKKEYARRPAPLIVLGHGYGGGEQALHAGLWRLLRPLQDGHHHHRVRQPASRLAVEVELAKGWPKREAGSMIDAIMVGTALTGTAMASSTSGADFFTSYAFHAGRHPPVHGGLPAAWRRSSRPSTARAAGSSM